MVNPVSAQRVTPPAAPQPCAPAKAEQPAGGSSFAGELRAQLEQVNQMQTEAEQNVQDLLTGRTDNLTGVIVSARKAEVAFSLLMEIRNKLVDAYLELRQMRV